MYAILDIETTGGKYDEEGITEIAIYRHDGETITDQFSSLVNPQIEIQPFVQKLTGISGKMLQNAPKFYEIAKRVVQITEDCVIVAHNAAFDYRILQTEFRRLGFTFERKSLCTVSLSQLLLPDQPAYSLGKLVRNLGIPFSDQHRAQGDAKVTVKLFELLLEKDLHKNILKAHISSEHPNKVPPKFLEVIDGLPSEMGVYYIHNSKNEIIYIGKSNNIKKRILNHLTGKSKKARVIQNEIHKATFALTGGELVSLLKEQNEIKTNAPKLNKAMKYRIFPMGIRLDDSVEYPELIVEQIKKEHTYFSVYKNSKSAKSAIFNWTENYGICLKKTSLSNKTGTCFLHEVNKCDGACTGKETPDSYRKKIKLLLADFEYPFSDFIITSKGRKLGESSFIYIKGNVFLGYGYYELNHQIKNDKQIMSRLISMEDNPDVQKLIRSFLSRKKYNKLIPLE
ncbi:MAG: exonuclease domain-containing protein [Flavobacteriaceae bacterium]|nr:exonuclease domain-containing protein [Flavobacteriaceae bacterium]